MCECVSIIQWFNCVFRASLLDNPFMLMMHIHSFYLLCLLTGFGNETTKEFRDFDFDTRTTSSFDIANSLWDMIAEGVAP